VTAEDKIPEPHEVIPPKMVDITGWNDQEELTKALQKLSSGNLFHGD